MIIELIQAYPRTSVIAISFLISFFISLVQFFVLDKDKMKKSRVRQKEIQKEMKEHRADPAKVAELNKELFSHMGETMKHSFKPMLITAVPILVIFAIIRGVFNETTIAGSWFWWYLGSAIVASLIFRKLFKLP